MWGSDDVNPYMQVITHLFWVSLKKKPLRSAAVVLEGVNLFTFRRQRATKEAEAIT
jgi:hypothetical protein